MSIERAIELQELAWNLQSKGEFDKARNACQEALQLVEKSEGTASPDVANLLSDLAEIECDQQNFHDALNMVERALAIMKALTESFKCESADRIRVRTLRLLGTIRSTLGEYARAETDLQSALAIALSEFGASSEETAEARNDLGVLYKHWGRFDEALQLYDQALRSIGEESLHTSTLHHNIGGILHAQGKFAAAEEPARKAWEISRWLHGEDDPQTMLDAVAYAAVLDGLERYNETEAIYRRALVIFEKAYGHHHFEVASTLHNLAALLAARDQYSEAEQAYRQALAIKENLLGPNTVEVALTRHNLGSLLTSLGRFPEAVPLLESAVAILDRSLVPDHPSLARAHENLQHAARSLTNDR